MFDGCFLDLLHDNLFNPLNDEVVAFLSEIKSSISSVIGPLVARKTTGAGAPKNGDFVLVVF